MTLPATQPPCRKSSARAALGALGFFVLSSGSVVAKPARAETAPPLPATAVAQPAPPDDQPWRLHEAIQTPWWFRFGLEQRTRFEHLQNEFHAPESDSSTLLALRTLLSAEFEFEPVVVGAELQDARAFASERTPLNTGIVNALEVTQAYVALRRAGIFAGDDATALTIGRFTMDIGSKRLVARNEFRNTLNSFSGIDLQWTSPVQDLLRTFAVLPVRRFPSSAAGLASNRIEPDQESIDSLLWGIFFGSAPRAASVQLETYFFGLQEQDGPGAPSSERQLFTPGVRALRAPARGRFDFQLEAMLQFGTSAASSAPTDTRVLTHRAGSLHATAGYRFDVSWSPRLALQYDFASGDDDPSDPVNGRFDPLYGTSRLDFGPTGLYGAFTRSNISSPGARLEVTPHRTFDAFVAGRPFWLAAPRDAWAPVGLVDASGASGSLVGTQLEGGLRWRLFPLNLAFEAGAAYLIRGPFARNVAGAPTGSPLFGYVQVTINI